MKITLSFATENDLYGKGTALQGRKRVTVRATQLELTTIALWPRHARLVYGVFGKD